MKKVFSLILVSLLVLSLTACSSSALTVSSVRKKGSIHMATSPDFPPFDYIGENNEVAGIEIDIWNIICEKLGVTLQIDQMSFDALLPSVQAGKIDVAVCGITASEERKKNTLFSMPFCLAAQSIVVPSGSEITCKADLEGKSVSVQSGTTAESFCTGEGYNVGSYESNTDAQLAMAAGKVDAWVIDDLTAMDMVATYNADHPDAPLVILSDVMTTEPYAFAFKLGGDDFVNEIDKILTELIEDGTMAEIFANYGLTYIAPEL